MSDDQMEQWLKAGSVQEIEAAAKQDPELIARGWRDGVFPWVKMAMLYETYPKTVPVLLACGADINAANRDQPDEDSLNAALAASDIDKVRFLLQHGAKPTKPRVVWGAVTASDHQLELVRMLEAHGADIHEVDEGGFSGRYANPLSLAKDYGLDNVVAYLESRGCVVPPPDE